MYKFLSNLLYLYVLISLITISNIHASDQQLSPKIDSTLEEHLEIDQTVLDLLQKLIRYSNQGTSYDDFDSEEVKDIQKFRDLIKKNEQLKSIALMSDLLYFLNILKFPEISQLRPKDFESFEKNISNSLNIGQNSASWNLFNFNKNSSTKKASKFIHDYPCVLDPDFLHESPNNVITFNRLHH